MDRIKGYDRRITSWFDGHASTILRVALGAVFVWFGAVKFVPGLSPAEGLVARTVGWIVDPTWFLPVLAVWEVTIGLGLIVGRFLRGTLLLMAFHMAGAFLPVFVLPEEVWTAFPFGLTIEGQYIVKNFVLISGAMVLIGNLHRQGAVQEPSGRA